MTIDYQPHEITLATEIARALNDGDSMSQHLKFVRLYREEFLRRMLEKALSAKGIGNRAAFYVTLVKRNSLANASARY